MFGAPNSESQEKELYIRFTSWPVRFQNDGNIIFIVGACRYQKNKHVLYAIPANICTVRLAGNAKDHT